MPTDRTEGDLPDRCYGYVPADGPKSGRKLRLCSLETGDLDAGIVGAAAAALGPGYRGQKVQLPDGEKDAAVRKVRAAWRKLHPDADDADMPSGIALSERRAAIFAEQSHTGFLVALWLEPDAAERLAVPGGEPADALHVTLCYCGDAADLGELTIARAVAAVERAVSWYPALDGKVGGYGRFLASETSDGMDVAVALPDVPGLVELRQAVVGALMDAGCPPTGDHGYTPHVTLAYVDPDAADPDGSDPSGELRFAAVTVMAGTRRIEIPLRVEPATFAVRHDDARPGRLTVVSPIAAFAEPPEWAPFLPVPGRYEHPVYGALDFSPERYARIVENFRAGVYQERIPVNAEHDVQSSGAVGWITDLRLAENGAIDARVEWNERGRSLIADDRYRYVSAEWYDTWTDPVSGEAVPDVAVGLALTTHPYFKESVLRPLAAGEAVITRVSAGASGDRETGMDKDTPTTTTTAAPAPPIEASERPQPTAPTAATSLVDVVITAEQRDRERREFADLRSRVELAERRATDAEGKHAGLLRERRKERFTAEVLGLSPDNRVAWFGSQAENVAHLVSLAEAHGDDSEQVRWAITQKRNEARAIQATGIFDPIGVGAAPAAGDVTARVRHLAEQKRSQDASLTPAQAETAVYDDNPELYVQMLRSRN